MFENARRFRQAPLKKIQSSIILTLEKTMEFFGHTRTKVTRNHAFISPDGHVEAPLPGWENTKGIILVSPRMGAKFSMFYALMGASSSSAAPLAGVQRFIWVQEGSAVITVEGKAYALRHESFAYCPAGLEHKVESTAGCKLVIFEKKYAPLAGYDQPEFITNHTSKINKMAFMGDEGAQLQLFLPDHPGYDMGVNLFSFAPGTALPFVETHIMEHGMMMTKGGGVYRLDDNWYPMQAGDALWMGPYCPQWFGALGKPESQYLYYKDVYRDPLS
ncbi:MAG: (S)-ureidoglycine aminohydrolase [Cellvibrionaceae bacterium]